MSDIETKYSLDGKIVVSFGDDDPDIVADGDGDRDGNGNGNGNENAVIQDSDDEIHEISSSRNASDTSNDKPEIDENQMIENDDSPTIIESYPSYEGEIGENKMMQNNDHIHDHDHDNDLASDLDNTEREIDFLKDDRSEMTNGRRIALSLMNNKWYYPNKDNDPTMEEDDGANNEDSVELIGQRNDQPSLKKAWAFFEHVILPRYVVENQPKKSKAEAGQRVLPTKLYNPYFSTMDDLAGFGLGIQLYFTHLRAIILLLIVAGLVALPNILYFSGPLYSNNQEGVHLALKGSAICTEHEFVPCFDCTDHLSVSKEETSYDRYRFSESPSGERITFALKNKCEGGTMIAIMNHLVMMIIVVIGLNLISIYIEKQEKELDDQEQTVKDYSIEILNPPEDTEPEEWKEYFMTNFEDIDVICCTVAVRNDDLVKSLVKRREILQQIRRALPPGESSLDKKDLEVIVRDIKEEKGCKKICCGKGLPKLYDKLLMLEQKIKDLAVDDKPVTSVFITFSRESSARRVLNILSEKRHSFHEGDKPLCAKEAAEPSAVRWQDLSASRCQILKSLIVPYLVTFLLLGLSTILVYILRRALLKPVYASFAVSGGNFIFPMVAKALTDEEFHRREGKKQASLYIKYAVFRWINTVWIIFIITPTPSFLMKEKQDLLPNVYLQFFAEIVTITAMEITDVWQNIKRHFLAPRSKTQEDMKNCMRGNEIDLAERYTTITKVLLLSLFYSPLYPGALFLGAFAILLNFFVDKFCLMRSWAPAPRLGKSVSSMNRKFFLSATGVMMATVNPYMWAGFNFDNLCAVDGKMETYFGDYEFLSLNTEGNVTLTIDNETQMYQYCEQNLLRRGRFPALPRFQRLEWMSSGQALGTRIYGWVGLGIIGKFVLSFFGHIIANFFAGKKKYKIENTEKPPFFARGPEVHVYIPEVKSDAFPYPLVACSVKTFDEKLFCWQSDRPYTDYDLTLDAEALLEEDSKEDEVTHIADRAFSKVGYWEASD